MLEIAIVLIVGFAAGYGVRGGFPATAKRGDSDVALMAARSARRDTWLGDSGDNSLSQAVRFETWRSRAPQ